MEIITLNRNTIFNIICSQLDGFNSQGENIADNGGVKIAYFAYKEWAKANGPEPQLPGLDYTPEQLFWISMAKSWCTKERTELIKHIIITDEHMPEEFRIIGTLSNMPEFSKDFNCPAGSRMNPIEKCTVW